MTETSKRADVFELELPQEEGGGMLSLLFRLYSMLGAVIADADDNKYFKFELLTKLLVNTVLDREVRDGIKSFMKTELKARLAELESPGNDEVNAVHLDVCMDAIGEVTTFIDRHLGVSVKLQVGGI